MTRFLARIAMAILGPPPVLYECVVGYPDTCRGFTRLDRYGSPTCPSCNTRIRQEAYRTGRIPLTVP
jgi:hypothetical protein